jgi:hypothetical protein
MTRNPLLALAVTAALLVPLPALAHHGSAAFDTGKEVTITGTVKEWVYSNPHCLLRLEVAKDDGSVVQWVAEGQAPNVIFPVGYRRDTFKAGDRVTLKLEPLKNGRTMGRILQTVLPDGTILGRAASPPPLPGTEPQP